ncbi:hypothetical protein HHK36_028249 [Tetracentron sinense]|uniref:Uncharacterized protein n=1 Tax=Tetracentron sinense TaxID=13715 RepID=A0A834YG99_TETSI|nr:hypothetical protein HHK36_028249 [Tetracentron sinense]
MNLGSPQADPIPLQLAVRFARTRQRQCLELMAFLEARFKEHSQRQDHINHYIFTDSDKQGLKEHSQRQDHINHYIFTDSDVAMIDDLGQLFYNYPNFDLALTFRKNKDQPLNSGFVAVRGTPDGILRLWVFLQEVLGVYSSKYMKASRMLGDQLALAWVVKSPPSFDAKRFTRPQAFLEEIRGASVLFLPCAIYNWRPQEGLGKFHGMPLDVKVVHFKGSRKRLMLESWNFFNSSASSDILDMLCLILKSGRTK